MAEAQTIEKPEAAPAAETPSPAAAASPAAPKPDESPAKAGEQPAPKRTSIYEAIGEPEPGQEGSQSVPATWREDWTKDVDPKGAELLKRYGSPQDLVKAHLAAVQKIRSGEYKRAAPPPEDPEAMKAWREEQGIPADPKDYDLPQVAGMEFDKLPDDVKENIGAIRSTFLDANLSKEQGTKVAKALADLGEKQMEAQVDADIQAFEATDDNLRADWGPDYKTNLKMNIALLNQTFGEEMANELLMARTPSGKRLADLPEFNKALNGWARASGSDVLYDPNKGGGGVSLSERKAEIEKVMNTDFSRYQRELEPEYTRILQELEKRGKL